MLTTLVMLSLTMTTAAEVAGNWTIAAKIMEMDVPLECTFAQDGETLSGTCKGPGAPPEGVRIRGASTGTKISWTYDIAVQGMDLTITYTGEVDADKASSVKGEISMMGQTSGAFTGTRNR